MKTLLTIIMAFAVTLTLSAQAVIVVQNATETRTFNTLPAAVEAAVDGDNIYLPGGSYVINNLHINKRLHIIGAGCDIDSTSATGRTIINGNLSFLNGSSNSMIQGIFFTNNIQVGKSDGYGYVSNILISRCNMNQLFFSGWESAHDFGANNFLVRECVIRNSMYCNLSQNHVIENCIIGGSINNINGGFTFSNCIFIQSLNFNYILYGVNAATFNNCIFAQLTREHLVYTNASPSLFQNCIFPFELSQQKGTSMEAYFINCIGSLGDVLSLFVNVPNNTFEYGYDYHLADNSIAIGAGIGGTDCGIYGGNNPYKEGAVPLNPHIQMVNIPSVTDGEGKLNIQIKVKAQSR